jgi:hypothetical protein
MPLVFFSLPDGSTKQGGFEPESTLGSFVADRKWLQFPSPHDFQLAGRDLNLERTFKYCEIKDGATVQVVARGPQATAQSPTSKPPTSSKSAPTFSPATRAYERAYSGVGERQVNGSDQVSEAADSHRSTSRRTPTPVRGASGEDVSPSPNRSPMSDRSPIGSKSSGPLSPMSPTPDGPSCTVSIVRHGERVNMSSAGGKTWMNSAEYAFSPLELPQRVLQCSDLDWNVPLSLRGVADAQQAGRRLAQTDVPYVHVFSSPAWRCQQTAQHICEALGTKFKVVAGLYECMKEGNGFADRAAKRFGKGKVGIYTAINETHC